MPSRLISVDVISGLTVAAGAVAQGAQGVDATAAEALRKKRKCATCHSLDQKEDGPAYTAGAP